MAETPIRAVGTRLSNALKSAFGAKENDPGGRVFVSQKSGYRLSLGDSEGGAKFLQHIFVLRPDHPSINAMERILGDEKNPRFKEVKSFEEAQDQLLAWGVKRPEVVALLKQKSDTDKALAKLGY